MRTIYMYNSSGNADVPSLLQLQSIRAAINDFVWRALLTASMDHQPGSWLQKVHIRMDGSKSTVVLVGGATAGLRIPFGGDVTLSPSAKGCFQVAEVNGVKFFLHGSAYTTVTSECYQSAWATKAVRKGHLCTYDYEETKMLAGDHEISIRLPFLQLQHDVAANEVVELTRPLMDTLYDNSTLAQLGSKAYEQDMLAKVGGGTPTDDKRGSKRKATAVEGAPLVTTKPYRHLLK